VKRKGAFKTVRGEVLGVRSFRKKPPAMRKLSMVAEKELATMMAIGVE
jgi:hypothetical protein